MTWYRARITWLSAAEGGRQHPLRSPRYSTPARFLRHADRWPNEAWSLVVQGLTDPEDVMAEEARVQFMCPKLAPSELLLPGSEFERFEGPRLVARGIVIDEAEAVESARPPP